MQMAGALPYCGGSGGATRSDDSGAVRRGRHGYLLGMVPTPKHRPLGAGRCAVLSGKRPTLNDVAVQWANAPYRAYWGHRNVDGLEALGQRQDAFAELLCPAGKASVSNPYSSPAFPTVDRLQAYAAYF